jgi:hypothetical protein
MEPKQSNRNPFVQFNIAWRTGGRCRAFLAGAVNRAARIAIRAAGALVLLAWTVLAARLLGLLLATLFVFTLLTPLRRRKGLLISLAVLIVLVPFQPIDLRFETRPGGPKLMRCCPGAPYRDYEKVLARDRAGQCAFCGDIAPMVGTRAYLYIVF